MQWQEFGLYKLIFLCHHCFFCSIPCHRFIVHCDVRTLTCIQLALRNTLMRLGGFETDTHTALLMIFDGVSILCILATQA